MNNKQYLGLVVLLVIVGAVAYYWYDLRPTKIKERCYAEAEFDRRAVMESDGAKRQEFINRYYEDCLMRFGLK